MTEQTAEKLEVSVAEVLVLRGQIEHEITLVGEIREVDRQPVRLGLDVGGIEQDCVVQLVEDVAMCGHTWNHTVVFKTMSTQRRLVEASLAEHPHEVYSKREPKPDKTQGVVAYLEVDGVYLRGDQFLEEIRRVVREEMRGELAELRARKAAAAE